MTKKIPDSVAGSDYAGDGWSVQKMLREKEGWQRERAANNNPTASIIRRTASGGAAYAGVAPTYTLVSDLSDLDVMAYDEPKRFERKYGSLYEEGDKEFLFYLADGVQVEPTDVIRYDGDDYRPIRVDFESESGRNEVLSRLIDPA